MISTYTVKYSPEASIDIKSIYSYISTKLHAPMAARNQVNRIKREIRSLNLLPSRYSFVDWEPWKTLNVHKLPVDNYIIFYIIDDQANEVTILRIVYGGRSSESLLSNYNK